jgi:hypothetical protein
LLGAAFVAAILVVATPARSRVSAAESPAAASPIDARGAEEPAASALAVAGRLGYALLLHARSLALEHNLQPALRLALTVPVGDLGPGQLELGGGASALLSLDASYGVWSMVGVARHALVWPGLSLGLTLALGAGHNAPILHQDLRAELPIVPYAAIALDALWPLGDGTWLGVELGGAQLSVLHLGAQLRWGGP